MSYLPSLPSCGDIKHFFIEAYHRASDGFNHYYPVVRDSSKEYGGRVVSYIKEQASEHPVAALALANVVIGLTISKISRFIAKIFNKLSLSNTTSKTIGFSATVGGAVALNVYLIGALGLSWATLPVSLAVGGGLAAGLALHKLGLSNVTLAAGAGFVAGAAL